MPVAWDKGIVAANVGGMEAPEFVDVFREQTVVDYKDYLSPLFRFLLRLY